MKKCAQKCLISSKTCDRDDCRMWIDYEDDLNCTLVCAYKNGPLTLREVAKREKLSFVRVKQIQDEAIEKISKVDSLE